MADLSIIPNGAVLIRNTTIEQVGPTRRVENLMGAKLAREIDATGRVVMPAFADADMALVAPGPGGASPLEECRALRLMSRQKAQSLALARAAEWSRYGCVTVGAYTPCATDIRNIGKILRIHRAVKWRPLRIRSIFSPGFPSSFGDSEALNSHWLRAVVRKKLAAIVELRVDEFPEPMHRQIAAAAAALGYAIRLRTIAPAERNAVELALSAGAMAIVGPNNAGGEFACRLASVACVRVIPASEAFRNPERAAVDMRTAIDEGAAVALASSFRAGETSSCNMQFLLHLAVDRLGLSAEEAIMATTWNGACALRLSRITGSLEPGKSADLLLMDVPDYRDLPRRVGHHDASLVMRAGEVVFDQAARTPRFTRKLLDGQREEV